LAHALFLWQLEDSLRAKGGCFWSPKWTADIWRQMPRTIKDRRCRSFAIISTNWRTIMYAIKVTIIICWHEATQVDTRQHNAGWSFKPKYHTAHARSGSQSTCFSNFLLKSCIVYRLCHYHENIMEELARSTTLSIAVKWPKAVKKNVEINYMWKFVRFLQPMTELSTNYMTFLVIIMQSVRSDHVIRLSVLSAPQFTCVHVLTSMQWTQWIYMRNTEQNSQWSFR
jgi:hypothetical protein